MEDYIVGLVRSMIVGTQSLGSNTSILTQTPETFNAVLYNGVTTIATNAVMPIGYMLLALFFLLELNNIIVRTDGLNGTLGTEIPFRIMFKFALCKLALDSTPLILGAIFQMSNEVVMNIGNVFGANAPNIAQNLEVMRETIGNMDFGVKLMMASQISILWLVYKFSTTMISVIIFGRMIEIYVMMAVAALPMATLGNSEASQIGKNFLKNFLAVCMQGVLIYIILSMYGTLIAGIATEFDPVDVTAVLWEVLRYTMVLVIAIFMTGKLSKSIFNAA